MRQSNIDMPVLAILLEGEVLSLRRRKVGKVKVSHEEKDVIGQENNSVHTYR